MKTARVSDKNYGIYRLTNHSKLEIYYGIATDFDNRWTDHQAGEVKATSHWDFSNDDIERFIVAEISMAEPIASSRAHNIYEAGNHSLHFPGYTVIQTSGL